MDRLLLTLLRRHGGQDDLTVEQIRLLSDLQDAHDETSRDDVDSIKSRKWRNGIIDALDGVATKHHLRFDPKSVSA